MLWSTRYRMAIYTWHKKMKEHVETVYVFFDRHLHMNMSLMILTMMRITSVLLTCISHIVDVFKRHLQSYKVIPSSDIHKMLLLQMTLLVHLPCLLSFESLQAPTAPGGIYR